jgi:aldose 1-epimerase
MDTYLLRNANGMTVRFIAYGGSIVSVEVPDRHGALRDVVLGYDALAGYENDRRYLGALIGRYANRIARGRFTLDGHAHTVTINDGPNHLHGGRRGFSRVPWDVTPFEAATGALLTYTSVTGDEGYPGPLSASVMLTLTDDNALVFDYAAITDEPTPVNLTHHGYFNLAGHDAGDVRAHELTIAASRFTPVDSELIPTGELRDVTGTPFDFRVPRSIGAALDLPDEQLSLGNGFDHNFVLDRGSDAEELAFAARLYEPTSGRVLEIHTTEPGLQFYSGVALAGVGGKDGVVYGANGGVALETQHFPDSPNQSAFPSTILRPGEGYTSRTIYRFSVA